jgi:ketosteroid isomerase-like protein
VADEAVFFGQRGEMRGRSAVVDGWKAFFTQTTAPFSWRPDTVSVLDSGNLALSSGPVFDPQGRRIGTFNSMWRLEKDGRWRVVFDNGCPACDCAPLAP